VFAELDAGRRARLADLVLGNEQVFITAAVAEDVPAALKAKPFFVAAGQISRDAVTDSAGGYLG
jgi:DNA replication and repair protein RecF